MQQLIQRDLKSPDIELEKEILGVIDSWRILGVVLHGRQILDARYWITY